MDDPSKVIIALSFFASVTYSVRFIINRIFPGGAQNPAHRTVMSDVSDERFARLEQAVEAIALEVERISEGQRFTTKLLADRMQPEQRRVAPAAEPVRHTTPH